MYLVCAMFSLLDHVFQPSQTENKQTNKTSNKQQQKPNQPTNQNHITPQKNKTQKKNQANM